MRRVKKVSEVWLGWSSGRTMRMPEALPTSPSPEPVVAVQEALNGRCVCLALDNDALARALDAELAGLQLSKLVRERCPYVFAARPVFVEGSQILRMAEVIQAVEFVVALPACRV